MLLIAIAVAFSWWIIRGFTIRVSGTWERVDEGLKPGLRVTEASCDPAKNLCGIGRKIAL